MHEKINSYLNEMQEETPNCGGQYHFTEIHLPDGERLISRLKSYLLNIEAYKNPFIKIGGKNIIVEERNIENLRLEPIPDYKNLIEDTLKYWREHRTSLDCRRELTDFYYPKEELFKASILDFLKSIKELKTYKMMGIDTYFAPKIGGDMIGDDIIFESKNRIYVLHFGWSS
ncbi:hypothetical protein SAMN04489761_0995 [Tenacibaculum sp. MAR_2009_124]|uniref:hypothetical protein n=1 Tax=Tenacibaculum sp. MAR_2009_124 TaxID=1250059 RepID=UPI00089872F7|nr:hypothetical protein [Tenacibaculum sp. MAR_2009_124]SEB48680.1 hypothetical protein SAMN04489761_0995 [Tenacibaculum sp. MAR_2009_124]